MYYVTAWEMVRKSKTKREVVTVLFGVSAKLLPTRYLTPTTWFCEGESGNFFARSLGERDRKKRRRVRKRWED